jgi:3-oxoacyl-[acyl-carrier protein] reductase
VSDLAEQFAGRTALVTGAAQGLGRAIASEFAARGARVVVVDIDGDGAARAAAELEAAGTVATPVATDVSDAEDVARLAEDVRGLCSGIDVVVNNAGVLDDFKPVLEVSERLWDRVLDVNLKGNFLVTKALLPQLLERGGGAVVNIASMAGTIAGAGGAAYTASKHGVIGLTRQLCLDYGARGIRANAICPGSMDTEMSRSFLADNPAVTKIVESVPAGRQGQPEEVARLACFLAGPEAEFIQGAAVLIDGGWTVR